MSNTTIADNTVLSQQKLAEKHDVIEVIGAKEHNLKEISLDIPRNKLVVITGISGSGKSSLAFDTIYAEGQRRYMETFTSYAVSLSVRWNVLM
jgi:excinuclease ABC subunit A